MNSDSYTGKGWLGKASAGIILGFTLALGISGLFMWITPSGLMAGSGKTQFAMWLVAPIWAESPASASCFAAASQPGSGLAR